MSNEVHEPGDERLRELVRQSLVRPLTPSRELREQLEARLDQQGLEENAMKVNLAKPNPAGDAKRRFNRPVRLALLVAAALAVLICLPLIESRMSERQMANVQLRGGLALDPSSAVTSPSASTESTDLPPDDDGASFAFSLGPNGQPTADLDFKFEQSAFSSSTPQSGGFAERNKQADSDESKAYAMNGQSAGSQSGAFELVESQDGEIPGGEGAPVPNRRSARGYGSNSASYGGSSMSGGGYPSARRAPGYPGSGSSMGGGMSPSSSTAYPDGRGSRAQGRGPAEPAAEGYASMGKGIKRPIEDQLGATAGGGEAGGGQAVGLPSPYYLYDDVQHYAPGEQYDPIYDNPFLPVKDAPLSTFSIDVDTASYANLRRFLTDGQLPPRDAVRIEELLNYFSYDYPAPKDDPFSVNMETAPCPWQPENLLLRVGLKGKEIHKAERPASNLVFLVDVSGSMTSADKLPLLRQSLTMLTRELGERDRVTIVTYAGEAGLRMEPTNGSEKAKITAMIDTLSPGGSTNGSAGIQLAYEQARDAFVKGGTNRVILCTDGDLNVGITSDDQLVELIAREAKSGVFLTVLGFGTGNLKDSKMEKLADRGNGVYAYIDGLREARKVLVEQMSGSLVTIAKDVKLQIEFNPAQVRSYRLIGYENRVLAAKDFNDDTKDAGEIGAGHTVTALYELVPADAPAAKGAVDELKYQRSGEEAGGQAGRGAGEQEEVVSKEILTLKLRYKEPEGEVSKKSEYPLSERGTRFAQASGDFRFAAAVAGFGMILRDSPHRGEMTLAGVAEIASSSLGEDKQGYRAELLDLIRRTRQLRGE